MLRRPAFLQKYITTKAFCIECKKEVSVDWPSGEENPDETPIYGECPDHPSQGSYGIQEAVDGEMVVWIGWSLSNETDNEYFETTAIVEDCNGYPKEVSLSDIRFAIEIEDWAPEKRID